VSSRRPSAMPSRASEAAAADDRDLSISSRPHLPLEFLYAPPGQMREGLLWPP
jgi:hypothetical protein